MKLEPMTSGLVIPRLDRYDGPLPEGWHWQVKLNDERCLLTLDRALNKKGAPLSPRKVKAYGEAFRAVRSYYAGLWDELSFVDLALLGYRAGPWETGHVVVLDVPYRGFTWDVRFSSFAGDWPAYLPEMGETVPDLVSVLDCYTDPRSLFGQVLGRVGLEGVVGRAPSSMYEFGKSRSMAKSRF